MVRKSNSNLPFSPAAANPHRSMGSQTAFEEEEDLEFLSWETFGKWASLVATGLMGLCPLVH